MIRFRLLPGSLYGRLLLVLIAGMLLAQLVSFGLHLMERDSFMFRISAAQSAQRIADLNDLFDTLTPPERARLANDFSNRNLQISFGNALPMPAAISANAALFSQMLAKKLPVSSQVTVEVKEAEFPPVTQRRDTLMTDEEPSASRDNVRGFDFRVWATLRDGGLVNYHFQLPRKHFNWPRGLLMNLLILVGILAVLTWFSVRWVTRPLLTLANAADSLGKNINVAPLEETGPSEVRRAAHAFNTMQDRLSRYIQSRTRILAAMSHDLKTPITRLRLRAELLDDPALRATFTRDLEELEAMVVATLGFMRGLDNDEVASAIDIVNLLENLRADYAELGYQVSISGTAQPYTGKAQGLKRCFANLVDNAVKYGGRADITLRDSKQALVVMVCDNGPGIPEAEIEKVFEPFYRVEASRNRDSGGTGLGLSIARDIAQGHNAQLQLKNRAQGGLEVTLTLPREA